MHLLKAEKFSAVHKAINGSPWGKRQKSIKLSLGATDNSIVFFLVSDFPNILERLEESLLLPLDDLSQTLGTKKKKKRKQSVLILLG